MALRLDASEGSRDPHGLGLALAARLPAASARRRRVGVEHEYAVFEGDRQVDFRDHLDRYRAGARALHPVNAHMLLLPSGLALMADGIVAETASPPETLRPGASAALDAWQAHGCAHLEAALPPSMRLLPGSTHISVETHPARTDQLTLWFAQTFAPALMLLTDHVESSGALVRPRPGRFAPASSSRGSRARTSCSSASSLRNGSRPTPSRTTSRCARASTGRTRSR